jgi:hypothetical protein
MMRAHYYNNIYIDFKDPPPPPPYSSELLWRKPLQTGATEAGKEAGEGEARATRRIGAKGASSGETLGKQRKQGQLG